MSNYDRIKKFYFFADVSVLVSNYLSILLSGLRDKSSKHEVLATSHNFECPFFLAVAKSSNSRNMYILLMQQSEPVSRQVSL